MKKTLLFALSVLMISSAFSQQLYSNFNPVSYYRTGNGQMGTPKVIMDDVLIPSSTVGSADSIRFTKLNFILARLANAPATTLNVYYSVLDDTATLNNNLMAIPPVNIGTISVPAQGTTSQYRIFSIGDSVNTLFTIKTDTGALFTNYQALFVGMSFSDTTGTGWAIATGGANYNRFWIYNADSSAQRAAYLFSTATPANPNAAFGIQAFGYGVGTLPVTFTSFKGDRKGNVNLLEWSTATEQNNKGFEIQRSADGKDFTTLSAVGSKAEGGNSTQLLNYNFVDEKPLSGSNFYRLKQIDKDGKFAYSSTVIIKGHIGKQLEISNVFPNPATTEMKVIITSNESRRINLVVTDINGKMIMNDSKQTISGDNVYTLDVRKLAKGNYYLKVVCAEGCEELISKFLKN